MGATPDPVHGVQQRPSQASAWPTDQTDHNHYFNNANGKCVIDGCDFNVYAEYGTAGTADIPK